MADLKFRHELKFAVSPHQYHVLRHRLRHLLQPDSHAPAGGTYRVTSLYLDDAQNRALYEKLSGVDVRRKVRVRIYNGDDGLIWLEEKLKRGALVAKRRTRLDRATYAALLRGRLRDADRPLLRDISRRMTQELLRPVAVVEYDREAYAYRPGNVRVTFDLGLRAVLGRCDLFQPGRIPLRAVAGAGIILEVKYDAFLPGPVQDLLQMDGVSRLAISKYVICRRHSTLNQWEDQ